MADLARDEIVLDDTGDSKRERTDGGIDDALSSALEDSVIVKQYYSKQRKFSDAEIQQMKDGIREICVNDFSDDYNLTDEEKYANAEEARIYGAVSRTKRKCNNIADFIIAVRFRLDAVDYIAKHNGVYDPEDFLDMVSEGKIILTGLPFPKYTGKDRKKINWDYIWEFCADRSKDPKEFRESTKDDDFYEHSRENGGRNLFSDAEYQRLVENGNSDEVVPVEMMVPSPKTMKHLIKHNPNIADSVVKYIGYLRKTKNNSHVYDAGDVVRELRSIEVLDKRDIRATKVAPPVFTGNYESASDWQKYQHDYYEWYISNVYVDESKGSRMTIAEYDQAQVRNLMEEAGWNVRKFRSDSKYYKKEKKAEKAAKKKGKRVKENLLESDHRNKKKKKHKETSEKLIEDMRRRQEEDLVSLTGGNYADFDDYVDAMENVDYDKIMKNRKG